MKGASRRVTSAHGKISNRMATLGQGSGEMIGGPKTRVLVFSLGRCDRESWAVCPSLPCCWNTGLLSLQIFKNEASLRIATQHMHPPDVQSQRAYAPARTFADRHGS